MQTLLNAAATAISASASFLNSSTFNVEEFEELLTKVKRARNKVYLEFFFELFYTPKKEWENRKVNKEFWTYLTQLGCVSIKYIQGYTGEILRYYSVAADEAETSDEKQLVAELKESGGAFVCPEMELIFILENSNANKVSLFHESGHIKFRREYVYKTYEKNMAGYDQYMAEEIFADDWGIRNIPPGERAEMLRDRMIKFLNADEPATTCFHFPRILNLWERYKESISS